MTTGTLDDHDLEARLRATLQTVAARTVVGDAPAGSPAPTVHELSSVRSAPLRRRRPLVVVGVAAGLVVALVVVAGVLRGSGGAGVVETPGAPVPTPATATSSPDRPATDADCTDPMPTTSPVPAGCYASTVPASTVVDGPEGSPSAPAPTTSATPPTTPIDGESLWPAEAPPDYCTGWQRYLDVQMQAPGSPSVQTEGFRRYTTQLAAIAPGDLGQSWTQLRDLWLAPDKAATSDDEDGSGLIHEHIFTESMAACPGASLAPHP